MVNVYNYIIRVVNILTFIYLFNYWDLGTSGLHLRRDCRMLVLSSQSLPFSFVLLSFWISFISLPVATHHGDRWGPMSPLGVLAR